MTLDINDFDGAPALDIVQFLQAQAGTGWISGCTPSLVTTDAAIRIDVTAGTVYVENTELQFSQDTIDLPDGDPTHPRKDIVYIDANNAIASVQGDPREAKPETAAARDTYQPEPPDLKDITGGQTAGCPIAEVWVPAGAAGESDLSDGTIDYVRDRRVRPWASSVAAGSSIDADTVDGEDASAFADATHASTHESGGSDTITPDNLAGFDEAAQDAAGALATDGLSYNDGANELGLNVVATGSVVLSSGSATIDTGVASSTTATFTVYIGPDTDDADVAADIRAASGGNYEIDIEETDTSVGTPTIEYDVVRLR